MYAALDVQVATAVELLLVAPVRISNLVSVKLGRNLVQVRPGGLQHLVFPAADVKNEEDLEFPLPPETTALLDIYCQEFRPRLLEQPGDWLFPGENGSHKAAATLSWQLRERVRALTGLSVTPHQFRHITAKLFLDAHPGGYEIVKRVLGHRKNETTTTFYASLETSAAVRHFDEAILGLRRPADAADEAARRGRRASKSGRACR